MRTITCAIFTASIMFLISGCSGLGTSLLHPEFTALKANGDANAVKVQGDIAPIKAPIKAEAQAQAQAVIGDNEANHTTVGGNMKVNNDSAIMKEYINGMKEWHENDNRKDRYIIGALVLLYLKVFALLTWVVQRDIRKKESLS